MFFLLEIILFTYLPAQTGKIILKNNWYIQSSAKVTQDGSLLSSSLYQPTDWYPTTVPATVVAALVANKIYPDPYFAMNLRSYPGMGYPVGENYSNLAMPDDSPFRVSWWYRTVFRIEGNDHERNFWLNFDGINFRANVWLNGVQISGADQMAGTWRRFEYNVTEFINPDQDNILAVEVFPPQPQDLAMTFVDWNPTPPDKMMGLWRDVYILSSGPVTVRYPHVRTDLELPSMAKVRLTVTAELYNRLNREIEGSVRCRIGAAQFEQPVTLAAHERIILQLTPDRFQQLIWSEPELWWPAQYGKPQLYDLTLEYIFQDVVSDMQSLRFGIREIKTEKNPDGYLVFKINGQKILIRGAGYTPEMLLRSSVERQEAEIRYVKDMNLNTIRLEGKLEDKHFFDYCDEQGILILAGWCCCDHWERWRNWDKEDTIIATQSLKDQIQRLRTHPCMLAWLNGSDNPPPPQVEQKYLKVLSDLDWPNPVISNATEQAAEFSGPSGMKMRGPYEYVPPVYWYIDKTHGGAYGFNTETSPGPAIPPLESLELFLPPDHLWPVDEFWNFHAGGGEFSNLNVFTQALTERYGLAKNVADYVMKAQAAVYESHRAMFEAFSRNKYQSTGIIQWMLNNAWPSMIWHLYDFYLRLGGSYFGTKKACEPLHVQYSYDDRSIYVINSGMQTYPAMKLKASLYNLDLTEKFTNTQTVQVPSDGTLRVFTLPDIADLSVTYFLNLSLYDQAGKLVSTNFYWLSTQPDILNDSLSTWYYTPQKAYANYKALQMLPKAEIHATSQTDRKDGDEITTITITNASEHLAFFLRLKLTKGAGGDEILPVLWDDNYISLMPGEQRQIKAMYAVKNLNDKNAVLEIEEWK